MKYPFLLSTYSLGSLELTNRIVMAPMTRNRSPGNVPPEMVAQYYSQRAGAGLIITEGTSPSPNGVGYPRIPGLYNEDQVSGWKAVAQAVHQKSGRIFVQLMHTGRVSHPLNLTYGSKILGPSAVAAPGEMYTDLEGLKELPIPAEMTHEDIKSAVKEYANAAQNAIAAGLDGVELHGANGYLIDQFINTASNHRTDQWGGSIDGRARFALSVASAAVNKIGAARVGIRLSPYGVFNGMQPDEKMDEVYIHLVKELSALGITYIHLVDHSSMGAPQPKPELIREIRQIFKGTLLLSGGYDAARAEADLAENKCDLVAFGRPFISNPNLVEKIEKGVELTVPNQDTFYTPGIEGYTDYSID